DRLERSPRPPIDSSVHYLRAFHIYGNPKEAVMRHDYSGYSSGIIKTTFTLASLLALLALLPIGASATVLNPAYMEAYCPVDETPLTADDHTVFHTGFGVDSVRL